MRARSRRPDGRAIVNLFPKAPDRKACRDDPVSRSFREEFELTIDHNPARPAADPAEALLGEPQTRRQLLGRAAVGIAAAGGAASMVGKAAAATSVDSRAAVLNFIATQEQFGVTFLTEAIGRAPGTPSAQFVPVLKAANTTEFDHVTALKKLGAKPLVTSYWIPDAAFGGGGAGLFASLEAVETIELSMYLIGVTSMTQQKNAFGARLYAEAMATESEHRVLARVAFAAIARTKQVPNNISFAPYHLRTLAAVKRAAEKLGVRYGVEGPGPGKLYEYPGNPLAKGVGLVTRVRRPS